VKLFLARGADPVEEDAEPWANPPRHDLLRAAGTQEELGRLLLKNILPSKTHIFG
jgi:hypothetical protein